MIYQRNASKNDPYQNDNVKYDSPVIVGILEERLVWSGKNKNSLETKSVAKTPYTNDDAFSNCLARFSRCYTFIAIPAPRPT